MHKRDNLKFYGEDKYWNLDLKDEFMANTRGLWKGNFDDKRRGSLFTLDGARATEEEALTVSISTLNLTTGFPVTVNESRKRTARSYC